MCLFPRGTHHPRFYANVISGAESTVCFWQQDGLLSDCGWYPLSRHHWGVAELCAGVAGMLA